MVHSSHAPHGAMVHSCHTPHPHIVHRNQRTRIKHRNRRREALAHSQRRSRVARPVHRLREDGVRRFGGRLHNDVIGLGHCDTKLVDADGFDRLAVSGNHCHSQPGDTDIEIGHRGSIDETKAHSLARTEDSRPVSIRRKPIGEIGVGVRADVAEVGRTHAHFSPHLPVSDGRAQTVLLDVSDEIPERSLMEVVVIRLLLELGFYALRVLVGPIREHDHVVAIVLKWLRILRIDHERTIHTGLLLQRRVAVIPVSSVLLYFEAIGIGLAGVDSVETQSWHAVHVGRHDNPVPVNRSLIGHTIRNA